RVRPAVGAGPPLHQGAEVHAAVALGEPFPGGEGSLALVVQGQPPAQSGVPAQGVVRPTLGLLESGLGTPFLQPMESSAALAAPQAVREVRASGGIALGRYGVVLPAGEQDRAGLRRGTEQQGPRAPAAGLRATR